MKVAVAVVLVVRGKDAVRVGEGVAWGAVGEDAAVGSGVGTGIVAPAERIRPYKRKRLH